MKKFTKIKNQFTSLIKILVQRVLRVLRGRNGWRWASAAIIFIAVVGLGVARFTLTHALTTTLIPNGDVVTGWPVNDGGGNDGTCVSTATHCSRIDDASGATDWIGTGTNGTTGETEEYDMTTVSVVSATQVQINVVVDSIIASTADTLSISLRVNGTAQTAQTCTMGNANGQTCTATFSGSWDQTAVDSMRVIITRNRLGSGQTASQDDDIRIHRVNASLTYTAPVAYEQAAYRWFNNQDSSGVTFLKTVNDAAATTSYVTGDGMATLSDGGYVTTGYLRNSGAGIDDALITRYDSSGTPIWSRTIGGAGNEYATSVTATSDGGIAVVGTTDTNAVSGTTTPYVAKFDGSGNLLWMRVLDGNGSGPDYAEAVASAGDGGVYFTGSSQSTGNGSSDMIVGRYDASGNLTWLKIVGGSLWDEGTAISVVGDGVLVGGQTATYGAAAGIKNAFVAKFSTAGALQWMTYATINGTSTDLPVNDMVVTTNGSILIVGETTSGPGGGLSDGYVAKFSSSGVFQWMYGIGTGGDDYTNSIVATSDGGAALAGSGNSYNINGDQDATLAKITDNGATSTLSWMTRLSNIADESATSVVVTSDGGYAMAGNSQFDGGSVILGRFTSTGTISGCGPGTCDTVTTGSAGYNLASVLSGAVTVASVSVGTPSGLTSNSVTPTIGTQQAVATTSAGSSIDVGSPLAALNTAATAPAEGTIFRLRLNLHISGGPLGPGANSFKMQFANKGANALCSSVPTGSYADLTTSSTGLQYANNTNAGNGLGLTTNANDPTHGSDTIVRQSYQEGGAFTATSQIAVGQDGLWDFAFTTYHSLENTRYCLRVVDTNGNLLNTYTQYPEIIMPSAVMSQASYRWFDPGALSTTFVKAYGGSQTDNGVDIAVTPDGGYVTAGDTRSYDDGTYSAFVAKYSVAGNLQWARTLGAAGVDKARGVAVTPSGDVVIAGSVDDYGAGQDDAFVAKFSSTGTFQWMRTLGTTSADVAKGITIDSNGDFALVGQTYGYGTSDAFVAKFSSTGTFQWLTTEGGTGSDDGNAITATSDGGYAIAGTHGSDAFVAKYSSSGGRSWIKTIGVASTDYAYGIMQDADGNFVLAGQVYAGSTNGTDAFIAKYVPSTDTWAWFKNLGGTGTDIGYDLARDNSNNYYLVGYSISFSGPGNADAFIAKYDPSGTLSWFRTFNGSSGDYVVSIAKTIDNRFALTGQISTPPGTGSLDVLLAVYDSNGNIEGCSTYCANPTPTTGNLTNAAAAPSSTATTQSPTVGQYNDSSTDNPRVTTISPTVTTVVQSAGVGAPLAGQNIAYDLDKIKPITLRMTMSVSGSGLANGASFKLQFADKGTSATCAAVPGGSYADITASTALYYYDGADSSGTSIGGTAGDPADPGVTNVPQTYQETNPFSTTSNVYAGQGAMWQFSLAIQPGSMKGKHYCVRIVKSTGFSLDAYSMYGEIAYAPTMNRLMKGGKWFDHSGVKRSLAL